MGGVMTGVPSVQEGGELDGDAAALGVNEAALPLGVVEGLKEHDPAGVEAFDEIKGPLDRSRGIVKVGPGGLVVGLDGGPVFGEGELGAGEGIHVGVGDVMHKLANCPAAFTVRGVELLGREAVDCVVELAGELGELADGGEAVVGTDVFGRVEGAEGVARILLRGSFGGHARELLSQTVAQSERGFRR